MIIIDKSMSETADGVVWVRGVRQKNEPGYQGNLVTVEIGDSETVTLAVVEESDIVDPGALVAESQAIKHMLTVVRKLMEKAIYEPHNGRLILNLTPEEYAALKKAVGE